MSPPVPGPRQWPHDTPGPGAGPGQHPETPTQPPATDTVSRVGRAGTRGQAPGRPPCRTQIHSGMNTFMFINMDIARMCYVTSVKACVSVRAVARPECPGWRRNESLSGPKPGPVSIIRCEASSGRRQRHAMLAGGCGTRGHIPQHRRRAVSVGLL